MSRGSDVLETVHLLFGAYLVGLGVGGGLVASLVRIRTADSWLSTIRLGVAGAFGVVGAISLLFAVAVLFGTSQLAPVLVTGATGLVMPAVAGADGRALPSPPPNRLTPCRPTPKA